MSPLHGVKCEHPKTRYRNGTQSETTIGFIAQDDDRSSEGLNNLIIYSESKIGRK